MSADIAEGIVWAVEQGADVLNLSFGGPLPDPLTEAAVAYALTQGVAVVASAGNSAVSSPFYPAG